MTEQDYQLLSEQLAALVHDVPHLTANLANASALIFGTLEDVNWVGFYLLKGDILVLGPFQGKPACIELKPGHGVCSAAVERDETMSVPNVLDFPGHIACDAASRSELVVPLHGRSGSVVGVLDIDSAREGRFSETDRLGLERMARTLERELEAQL
ncbi:MAG: GAF domain-containing protein [Oscillospiraceae bacterium]|nr:GAF domain-containing protein [Oscillospiraceae bacterium]